MKAITLHQPWATLVALGLKRIETRSWRTTYRGPLLIHAAKGLPPYAADACLHNPHIRRALIEQNVLFSGLPRGVFVARCVVSGYVPTQEIKVILSEQEIAFGNYTSGRYAWQLEQIEAFSTPVPARGYQRLWEYDGPLPELYKEVT